MTCARTASAGTAEVGATRRRAYAGYRWLLMRHALDGLLIIAIAGYLPYRARGRRDDGQRGERLPDREAQETR